MEPVYGPLFMATIPTRSPYEAGLKIESTEDGTHYLIIDMKLFDGAHFASPFSNVDYNGRFKMTINDEERIKLTEEFIEIPSSTKGHDLYPLVNDSRNWVKENITYKQPFKLLNKKDFRIHGNIQFTIEPRCTSEFIPFSIISKDGNLDVIIDGC